VFTSSAGFQKLVITVPIAAVFLIAWAGKSTVAQAPANSSDLPVPTLRAAVSSSPRDLPPPVEQSATPTATPGTSVPVPILDDPPSTKSPAPSAEEAPPLTSAAPADATDDPEKAAIAFVEQNEKHAENQLKALREEEAKLRERLTKVEGGIKRWESLLGALKQSRTLKAVTVPKVQSDLAFPTKSDVEPASLEPVEPLPQPKVVPAKK
jgi:hypothetical protein